MKKLLLLVSLLTAFGRLQAQTVDGQVNLNFYVGVLTNADGTLVIPDGSLLQIIASYNGTTIAAPTAADFLGGDSQAGILWQGAFDSSTSGQVGVASVALTGLDVYVDGTIGNFLTAGDSLFVRWYPSLTTSDTAPGVTSFGQYGYSAVSGTVLDSSWVVPAAGNAGTDYFFLTTSVDGGVGTLADTLGQAASSTSAVPEPSTTAALLGLAAIGVCWGTRRRALRAS